MTKVTIDGVSIAYETIGEGRPWVLTTGGRFSRDVPGFRELATALADLGNQVVIWDRPNCGESDVCFTGPSEAAMSANALVGLVDALGCGPAVLGGGSSGARISTLAAAARPDVAAGLAMWWPSGNVYELMNVALISCGKSLGAVWNGGMEAVVALPEWQDVIERNPGNRQRFLDQDRAEFLATMERWMAAHWPGDGAVVPGLSDDALARVKAPAIVFQNGTTDANHPRETSDRLARILPNVTLVDPPWPDTEWIDRQAARAATGEALFGRWHLLAPALHAWATETL